MAHQEGSIRCSMEIPQTSSEDLETPGHGHLQPGPNTRKCSPWSPFSLFGVFFVALGMYLILLLIFICKGIRFFCLLPWRTYGEQCSNKDRTQVNGLKSKYNNTARWYDLADWYWERVYAKLRPKLLSDISGNVLEVGVGTGNNLSFYNPDKVKLTAIDLSNGMLERAKEKQPDGLDVSLLQGDATVLEGIPTSKFDCYVSTFLCCVLPSELQEPAIEQMVRVVKPGGRFRILEMVYSRHWMHIIPQILFQPWVTYLYGARFDRKTLDLLEGRNDITIVNKTFIQADTYLYIEGVINK
mmetsp:Transcript_3995/g.5817  ORF Transcript_3995/g.5817 Transcript_3995/m.5817 type:complete len:298 (+) Transcript_3995:125-1018(+)